MKQPRTKSSKVIARTVIHLFIMLKLLVLSGHLNCQAEEALSYERDIRPIFRAHCFDCHGATDEVEGGLDLRLVRFMKRGGDSGPAIEVSKPDSSLLLDRIASGEMPPGDSSVTEEELATLTLWIRQGCRTLRPEPESIGDGLGITPEERAFWAFQPIMPASEELLQNSVPDSISKSYVDKQFISETIDLLLAKAPDLNDDLEVSRELRKELVNSSIGTIISNEASKATLIRRVYYDLLGLPPTPEQMNQWLLCSDSNWYSEMINELLSSPQYGERWGRHWLDIAGYADSEGYTNADAIRPWAWKFRDWVVESFNEDKPFDQFVIEQLAGDELAGSLEGDLSDSQIKLLTATGFLRMAADGTGSGSNTPEARNQVIADTLKIIGTSLLGLSIQCAQCHDHRYDPIPQEDYYALRAVLDPAMNWQKWKVPNARLRSLYTQADRDIAASVEKEAQVVANERKESLDRYMSDALSQELERQPDELREALRTAYETPAAERNDEQNDLLKRHPSVNITPGNLYQYIPESKTKLAEFDSRINQIRSKKPEEQFIRALTEPLETPPETKLFHRGNHEQPKQIVHPHALQVTCPENQINQFDQEHLNTETSGRRLAMATWITDEEHPLFARVIANRIWLHHFGKGIVETPADFGQLGSRPTYPKLLDWIANEFRTGGWSLKSLHRTLMNSRLYRQKRGTKLELRDGSPQRLSDQAIQSLKNYDFKFANLIRLDAEVVRDSILMISGNLDTTLGGKPMNIKEDDTGAVIVDGEENRRSLYIQARRTKPVSILQAFDAPVMETNCEIRVNSTVATQSLMMLNGEFILSQSEKLAERIAREAISLPEEKLKTLPTIPSPKRSQWSYGFGKYNAEAGQLDSFQPLAHWTGSQWQASENLPDPQYGWVLLNQSGGHPDSVERSVIRRWKAADSGTAKIQGTLSHGSPNGDGVRGRIIINQSTTAGSWEIKKGSIDTNLDDIQINKGDLVDFVTESIESHTSDSFNWPVAIKLVNSASKVITIQSESDFSGPEESVNVIPGQIERAWQLIYQRQPSDNEMDRACRFIALQVATANDNEDETKEKRAPLRQSMTNLCQMLLSSNEFFYVE